MSEISFDGWTLVEDQSGDDCTVMLRDPEGKTWWMSSSGYYGGVFDPKVSNDAPEVMAAMYHLWDQSEAFLGDQQADSSVPLLVVGGSVLAHFSPQDESFGDFTEGGSCSGSFPTYNWSEYLAAHATYAG